VPALHHAVIAENLYLYRLEEELQGWFDEVQQILHWQVHPKD
jgi:hypothetical protein